MCTARSIKRKWPWFLGIAIILLVLVLIWLDRTIASSGIIDPRSAATYTREELVNLYWENKDDMDEVALAVLASNAIKQRIIDSNEDDWQIHSDFEKGDFPEANWNMIVALFHKIKCYEVVRHCWYGVDGAFSIDFGERKVDGKDTSYSLFYFRDVDTMEFYRDNRYTYSGLGWKEGLEYIDGGWYVHERIIPRGT